MKRFVNVLVICALAFVVSGCSTITKSWRSLIGGKEPVDPISRVTTPRFSEQENIRVADNDKQYRRMNRQRFEEEADVKEGAGSLWVMEGQGAYLFSQNQMRMVGDLLNVKVEGAPKSQLQTKVRVISKLLDRLEAPRGLASVKAAQEGGGQSNQAGQQGQNAQGQQNAQPNQNAQANAQGADGAAGQAAEKGGSPNDPPFAVQQVPTRIVEQLKDGSYRVRGMQPFMIGKREYKVIVTGIVRAEDFNDEGIEASKLLDPQFDIVSSRKGASL